MILQEYPHPSTLSLPSRFPAPCHRSLFSTTYKLLFSQLLCFDNLTNSPPGVGGRKRTSGERWLYRLPRAQAKGASIASPETWTSSRSTPFLSSTCVSSVSTSSHRKLRNSSQISKILHSSHHIPGYTPSKAKGRRNRSIPNSVPLCLCVSVAHPQVCFPPCVRYNLRFALKLPTITDTP